MAAREGDSDTQILMTTWQCANCSFENEANHLKCNVCGFVPLVIDHKPNELIAHRVSFSDQSTTPWSCDDCTYDNIADNIRCQMCGASQTIELDTDQFCPRHNDSINENVHDNDPNLSENESITMLVLSPMHRDRQPTNNHSNSAAPNPYMYHNPNVNRLAVRDDDDDEVQDISYVHNEGGRVRAHQPIVHDAEENIEHLHKLAVWNGFKRRLIVQRTCFILTYLMSFMTELYFIQFFSFWFCVPMALSAIFIMLLVLPFYRKMNEFLCVRHWLLRSLFHTLFRALNVVNCLLPIICVKYRSDFAESVFYAQCGFMLLYFMTIFCVDFVIYEECKYMVSSFKLFLYLIERYNYKLNRDGSWSNPMEGVKCVNQRNVQPIGGCQVTWSVLHIVAVAGTFVMCILLVLQIDHTM